MPLPHAGRSAGRSAGRFDAARLVLPPLVFLALLLAYNMTTSTTARAPPPATPPTTAPSRLFHRLRAAAAASAASASPPRHETRDATTPASNAPTSHLLARNQRQQRPPQQQHNSRPLFTYIRRAALPLLILYICAFAFFATSPRAQAYLIYLHWLKPPILYPLTDLRVYKLAAVARNVRATHLRGWHLLPPGPPFAPPFAPPSSLSITTTTRENANRIHAHNNGDDDAIENENDNDNDNDNDDNDNDTATADLLPHLQPRHQDTLRRPTAHAGPAPHTATASSSEALAEQAARDAFFEQRIAAPRQTVVLFLHGNSGTRACPGKRVDTIKLLNAQLAAHVVTFDYSGFADSPGRPHEAGLGADARTMLDWVLRRVAPDTTVLVYGQSLGSFAAVDAVRDTTTISASFGRPNDSHATTRPTRPTRGPDALILDAAPASLVEASLTHPVARAFRVLPRLRMEALFRAMLSERLDSEKKIADVRVPILVLHGKRDTMISVEQGRMLARSAREAGNAHVEMHEFEECGHADVSSAPGYLSILHNFVDRVRERTTGM